jgi:hypothetical protein
MSRVVFVRAQVCLSIGRSHYLSVAHRSDSGRERDEVMRLPHMILT